MKLDFGKILKIVFWISVSLFVLFFALSVFLKEPVWVKAADDSNPDFACFIVISGNDVITISPDFSVWNPLGNYRTLDRSALADAIYQLDAFCLSQGSKTCYIYLINDYATALPWITIKEAISSICTVTSFVHLKIEEHLSLSSYPYYYRDFVYYNTFHAYPGNVPFPVMVHTSVIVSPTPSPTASPSPSPSPSPSSAPSPSASPSASPSPSPLPSGDVIIINPPEVTIVITPAPVPTLSVEINISSAPTPSPVPGSGFGSWALSDTFDDLQYNLAGSSDFFSRFTYDFDFSDISDVSLSDFDFYNFWDDLNDEGGTSVFDEVYFPDDLYKLLCLVILVSVICGLIRMIR